MKMCNKSSGCNNKKRRKRKKHAEVREKKLLSRCRMIRHPTSLSPLIHPDLYSQSIDRPPEIIWRDREREREKFLHAVANEPSVYQVSFSPISLAHCFTVLMYVFPAEKHSS